MLELIITGFCVLLAGYAYVLYPRIVHAWSKRYGHPWKRSEEIRPFISIILSVYNEERILSQCLDAILGQKYPNESFEVLIGSDGSSDGTAQLLWRYAAQYPEISIFDFPNRRGKIPVVNELVAHARGEVLFFTDADVTLERECLKHHASHYADEVVGGVAGNLLLSGEEGIRAEPLGSEQYYMSIENRLRMDEASLHSTVGIFGGHYSIRRSLWKQLPNKAICDELYIALTIVQSGKRMVFERLAVAREFFCRSMREEFHRKARFAARGLATLAYFPRLLWTGSGWPAVMLWSHKLLRWLAPFAFAALLATSLYAIARGNTQGWVEPVLIMEAITFLLIATGFLFNVSRRPLPVLSHVYWFAIMNLAFGIGVLRFLFKREKAFWAQSTRVAIAPKHGKPIVPIREPPITEEALHS